MIRLRTRFDGKFKGFNNSSAIPCVILNSLFFKIETTIFYILYFL